MEIKEAFEILNLNENSAKENILKQYKSLVKVRHPDKGGSNDAMSKLNQAKELSISYIENKALVKIVASGLSEIVKSNNEAIIKRQGYSSQTNSLFSKITRQQTGRYKSIKNMTKMLGVLSGALTLFSTKLIPIFPKFSGEEGNPTLTLIFGITAAATGIYYMMFNYMTERIKDSIDDFKDFLDDKASYLDLLNSILFERKLNSQEFTKREFEPVINDWIHESKSVILEKLELDTLINKDSIERTARRIGERDFSKLIISKGLENGLIKENETHLNGMTSITYSFGNNKTSA